MMKNIYSEEDLKGILLNRFPKLPTDLNISFITDKQLSRYNACIDNCLSQIIPSDQIKIPGILKIPPHLTPLLNKENSEVKDGCETIMPSLFVPGDRFTSKVKPLSTW